VLGRGAPRVRALLEGRVSAPPRSPHTICWGAPAPPTRPFACEGASAPPHTRRAARPSARSLGVDGAVAPYPQRIGDTRGGAASRRNSARLYEHSTRERVKRTRKDTSAQPSATAARWDGLGASTGVAVSVRGAGGVSLTCQRTLIACACFSLKTRQEGGALARHAASGDSGGSDCVHC